MVIPPPNIDLQDPIRVLDQEIKSKIIHQLNTTGKWEDLLARMEEDKSLTRDLRTFDRYHDQTEQLIDVLQGTGMKISHLVYYLQQIRFYPALVLFGIVEEDVPPGPPGGGSVPTTRPIHPAPLPQLVPSVNGGVPPPLEQQRWGAIGPGWAPPPEPLFAAERLPGGAAVLAHPARHANPAEIQRPPCDWSFTMNPSPERIRLPIIVEQPRDIPDARRDAEVVLSTRVLFAENYQWMFRRSRTEDSAEPVGEQGTVDHDGLAEYKIESMTCHKAGWYRCEVWNGVGRTRTKEVKVTVLAGDTQGDQSGLVIDLHPRSTVQRPGASCRLECYAHHTEGQTVAYQWFHRSRVGRCGRPIRDAQSCTLEIEPMELMDFGEYYCVVQSEDGDVLHTEIACVTEDDQVGRFRAKDKVALVIGVSRIVAGVKEQTLPAVRTDVIKMSCALKRMGFKVISAINMTKNQMRQLLKYFYKMIKEGVYAVVYLAGHGFEFRNETYLKCNECGTTSFDDKPPVAEDPRCALRIGEVESSLRFHAQKAGFVALIVDVCRTRVKPDNQLRGYERTETQTMYTVAQESGNMIVFYSTCSGAQAFEDISSMFTSRLLEHIESKDPLQLVAQRVLDACHKYIHNLRRNGYHEMEAIETELQNALTDGSPRDVVDELQKKKENLKSNLAKLQRGQAPVYQCAAREQRSLMDELQACDNTIIQNENLGLWTDACASQPLEEHNRNFVSEQCTIEVTFHPYTSNSIAVTVVTSKPKGQVEPWEPKWIGEAKIDESNKGLFSDIEEGPVSLLSKDEGGLEIHEEAYMTRLTVEDLHQLQEMNKDLIILLNIRSLADGSVQRLPNMADGSPVVFNLGRPLLAAIIKPGNRWGDGL